MLNPFELNQKKREKTQLNRWEHLYNLIKLKIKTRLKKVDNNNTKIAVISTILGLCSEIDSNNPEYASNEPSKYKIGLELWKWQQF